MNGAPLPAFVTPTAPPTSGTGTLLVEITTRKAMYQLFYNLVVTGTIVYGAGMTGPPISANLVVPLQVIIA